MSSVGLRSVGWLAVLCGIGCASAPVATVSQAVKATKAGVESPVPAQPPLTPPPPEVVEAKVALDLGRLVASLTAGTNPRLDFGLLSELWRRPGTNLLSDSRALDGAELVEAELSLTPGPSSSLHEWRSSAMRQIDALLPEGSELGSQPSLRLGLIDLAFEAVDRVAASHARLGSLKVALSHGQAGTFGVSGSVELGADSALARAAATAKNVRVPEGFWDLPAHTDEAVFFDASLLSPLWELSPRTRALFAEAGGTGNWATQVLALPGACAQPGRAWTLSRANPLESEAKRTGPPMLPTLDEPGKREQAQRSSYTLLGIEDPERSCAKALRAVLATHERLSRVAGRTADGRHVSPLPVDPRLPPKVELLRLGNGDETTYFALAERKGVLWIGGSNDLTGLKAGLVDLLLLSPERRALRTRPELAILRKSAALVSGFVREDELTLSSLGFPDARQSERAANPASKELLRVAFAITKEQAALRVSGWLEARSVRALVAGAISGSLGALELNKLPAGKLPSALALLEVACELGSGDACNIVGLTYGDARGVPKDTARAVRWLETGCGRNYGQACTNLAFFKTLDKAEEIALLQKGCELQSSSGCAWWGIKLLESDKPSDRQQAFEKLALACNRSVSFACARIGSHYMDGIDLPKDEDKGADFHQRACDLGLGVGCVGLATALAKGKGRTQDTASAFRYLERACELDRERGCYVLGLAYLGGEVTARDETAARRYLGIACDAEHADACRALAEISEEP